MTQSRTCPPAPGYAFLFEAGANCGPTGTPMITVSKFRKAKTNAYFREQYAPGAMSGPPGWRQAGRRAATSGSWRSTRDSWSRVVLPPVWALRMATPERGPGHTVWSDFARSRIKARFANVEKPSFFRGARRRRRRLGAPPRLRQFGRFAEAPSFRVKRAKNHGAALSSLLRACGRFRLLCSIRKAGRPTRSLAATPRFPSGELEIRASCAARAPVEESLAESAPGRCLGSSLQQKELSPMPARHFGREPSAPRRGCSEFF